MAPVPEFYSRAADYTDSTPAVFRHLQERTTNLAIWQQNPVTDYSPELQTYLRELRETEPQSTGNHIPQDITFNNGETIVVGFDEALLWPGHEHLKNHIRDLGNAVIDSVGLPVTFFPEIEGGKGLSSLKYLSRSDIQKRIKEPEADDLFHLDGQQPVTHADFSEDSLASPSFSVTVITDLIGKRRTRVLKGAFVDSVTRETLHQFEVHGPRKSTWDNAVKEVAQRNEQVVYQDLQPGQVGAFAIMPPGVRGRNLYEAPTRVFGLHRAPLLQKDDGSRLTLVLRPHIGGFTPKPR